MGKKAACALFTALILLACLVPSAGMLLPREADTGGNETLAALPGIYDRQGRLNTQYLSQLQRYAEDNHYLRQRMITLWSELNVRYLGTSIAEDVVLGTDGWLYFGDTLPDYAGTDSMTEREIFSAARNLALAQEYCESRGAEFLFTVAPNKNSLYPERMPGITPAAGPGNAERLAEELERQGVCYLDLFALFRGREETLYFASDSHWNARGAALAADAVNGALGRTTRYFDGPFDPASHRGDLYDMLYPAGTAEEGDFVCPDLRFTYDAPIRSAENLTIMTSGGGEGSLLMFRDSFGNNLYPYLADSFASALFSRAMPYRLDLTAAREADFVAAELVERNLRYLIREAPVMPAPRRQALESARGEGFISLAREAPEEGHVLSSGTLPRAPDSGSPVLVNTADGGCYEAFLLEDGRFGLYLPEDAEPESAVFYAGGGAVRLPLIW